MREKETVRMTGRRILVYIIGLIVLALGIDLNTKTKLGISPIISIPYNISQVSGFMLGLTIFVYYTFLVVLQWILLRRDFPLYQFLQVPCAFVTSAAVQVFDTILPSASSVAGRIAVLILAIIITAIGAGIVVAMQIVPNPADGLANIVGAKLGHDFGFGKNVVDFCSIGIALLIGFIATHGILGIGIGTIISMILTGRFIALFQKMFNKIFVWTQK